MEQSNITCVEKFTLLGFSHLPDMRITLIYIFSLLYACTLLGNCLIILLINKDHRLHKPMYFFLANLSTMDLSLSSVTVPKMISDLITSKIEISFRDCMTQLFFFIAFTGSESPLLSVMAIDRYIAICNPLRYGEIMTNRQCSMLISAVWILGAFYSLMLTMLTSSLDFCGSKTINQFFCDILSLFQLASSNIIQITAVLYVLVFFNGIFNLSIIFTSYISIVTTILKIKSKESRRKAFSTCASHLMVVSLYYFTIIATYLHPTSSYVGAKDKTAAVIYSVVTPLLNPIIYSLRNNDVKKAFAKLL